MKLKEYKKPWNATLQGIKDRLKKQDTIYNRLHIACLITAEELKILWFRDKAYLMKKPSIDRKNSLNDYTIKNCRYVEFRKNCGRIRLTPELLKFRSERASQQLKKLWKNPAYRRRMSRMSKNLWKDMNYKKRQARKIKNRMLASWKDPVYRAKRKKKYHKRRI